MVFSPWLTVTSAFFGLSAEWIDSMEKQRSYFHSIFKDRPWLLKFGPWPCFLSWFISKGHWIHGMLIAVLVKGNFFGKPLLQPWQRNHIDFKEFTSDPLSRGLAIRQSSKQVALIAQYAEEQLCLPPHPHVRHMSEAALAFHPLLPACLPCSCIQTADRPLGPYHPKAFHCPYRPRRGQNYYIQPP